MSEPLSGLPEQVPVFALGQVLFPRGLMPLRVFETRYMDMVKDCLKTQSPFAVALIHEGAEVGGAATVKPVACLASVREWDMPTLGVLHIVAEGGERVRLQDHRIMPNGLLMAGAERFAPELPLPVPAAFEPLVRLLRNIVETTDERLFPRPLRYDDAVWVSFRLAELLPLPAGRKWQLLALEDPLERLAMLQAQLQGSRRRS